MMLWMQSLVEHWDATGGNTRRGWIDGRNKDGETPLIVASRKGMYQIVELLLIYGADVDAQGIHTGQSALHASVAKGHIGITELLLRHDASPFMENEKGLMAMDLACMSRQVRELRCMESKAIWCGWLEQRVSRLGGLSATWEKRWVVVTQRLKNPRKRVANQANVRVVMLCYENDASWSAVCKCWIDCSNAVDVSDASSLARTGNMSPSEMELRLHRRHPPVSGCYTTKSRHHEIVMHFRPSGVDAGACRKLLEWSQCVNWAAQLGYQDKRMNSIGYAEQHPANVPPSYLQPYSTAGGNEYSTSASSMPYQHNNNNNLNTTATTSTIATVESDAEIARALQEEETGQAGTPPAAAQEGLNNSVVSEIEYSISAPCLDESESRQPSRLPSHRRHSAPSGSQQQQESSASLVSGGQGQDCVICMDKKIEYVYCHEGQVGQARYDFFHLVYTTMHGDI